MYIYIYIIYIYIYIYIFFFFFFFFFFFNIASAWVVPWNILDTKHLTSSSSMRVFGTICLSLRTGSWIGGAVTCPCLLATVIFVCQHQTPLRVTRQMRRMVQPGSPPPRPYLPVSLRHQREPAITSPL